MYFGPDSFTFRVHDASVDSETATGSIVIDPVNDPPDAVSESIFLMKGETTSELVGGATALLSNDSDIEGRNLLLSTTPVTGPASGTLDVGIKPEVIHSNGFE